MIHIEKNQKITENDNLRVYSPTGDYQDNDLIEVYDISNPEIIAGAFAAQYIRYGGIVYKFNDPQELGRAILNLDSTSTHDSASFIRMQDELLAKLNGGNLNAQSLQETITDEMNTVEQKLEDESNLGTEEIQEQIKEAKENIQKLEDESNLSNQTTQTNNTSSSPEVPPVPIETQNTTSTPPVIETPISPATSTDPIIEQIIPEETIDIPITPEATSTENQISILKRKSKRNIV